MQLAVTSLKRSVLLSASSPSIPEHIEIVRNADPTVPFDVGSTSDLAHDLRNWVKGQSGELSETFGYSYDTLKQILTPTLRGNCTGGGGGNDEFKRVMRIIVEFLD